MSGAVTINNIIWLAADPRMQSYFTVSPNSIIIILSFKVRRSMEALLESGNVHDVKQRQEIKNLLEEANKRDPARSFKR